MDIQVGDRVTYRRNDDRITRKACITTQANNLLLNTDEYEILKIERPKWEVVEEKKELLTDEEREFLKQVLKFGNYGSDTGNGEILFIKKRRIFFIFFLR